MINTLIFDFGAVLLPLDPEKTNKAFEKLGARSSLQDQRKTFEQFETGKISGRQFISDIQPHFFRKNIFPNDLKQAWNAMLGSLPEALIPFLKKLKKDGYELILLSNTNEFHVEAIREAAGPFLYRQFTRCFDAVYYSHEVGLRKPDEAIFQKILKEQAVKPEECFYLDDTEEHIDSARELGLHGWHFDPKEDQLEDLRKKLSQLEEA